MHSTGASIVDEIRRDRDGIERVMLSASYAALPRGGCPNSRIGALAGWIGARRSEGGAKAERSLSGEMERRS